MFDHSDYRLTLVNSYLIESARICLKGPYTHNFQLIVRHMMPRISLQYRAIQMAHGLNFKRNYAVEKNEHLSVQLKTLFSMNHQS